jgi:hypothetical protein
MEPTLGANLGHAAASGLLATGAVEGAMAAARRLGATDVHFPYALGTVFGPKTKPFRALGFTLFIGNGLALALGYRVALGALGAEHRVSKGAALGLVHGAIAAGGAFLFSPLHPRPAQAGVPSQRRLRAGELAVLCGVHVLYGALLGAMFDLRSRR